jgi:hypothetical protein
MLDDLNEIEEVAEQHYRLNEYDEASEVFEMIHASWNDINVRAARVKRNTLIWVYTIEWLAVLGVSLVSGTFLWLVLARRRLYQEVETTMLQRKMR